MYLGKLELLPLFMHGWDNAYLGTVSPSNGTLPAGAQAPTFNGGFLEAHYYVSPQLVFMGRYEKVNVGTQANISNPGRLRQRHGLFGRLPLVSDHVQPRGLGVAQRILDFKIHRHRARKAATGRACHLSPRPTVSGAAAFIRV